MVSPWVTGDDHAYLSSLSPGDFEYIEGVPYDSDDQEAGKFLGCVEYARDYGKVGKPDWWLLVQVLAAGDPYYHWWITESGEYKKSRLAPPLLSYPRSELWSVS